MAAIPKIYSGTKFFRYAEGRDEPEIIRIYNMPKENSKTNKLSNLFCLYSPKTNLCAKLLNTFLLTKISVNCSFV